eukprot:4019472-Prymnesium_polylepis.1
MQHESRIASLADLPASSVCGRAAYALSAPLSSNRAHRRAQRVEAALTTAFPEIRALCRTVAA